MLYIHTSHKMYCDHQSNMTLLLRESDMTFTDTRIYISDNTYGYVSHSFNQFILIDNEDNVVTLDHGDAYPRALVLIKYPVKAGGEKFGTTNKKPCEKILIHEFPGESGKNFTGAGAGGLAETSTGYLTAYNYRVSNDFVNNIYVSYTPKDGFSQTATTVRNITSYAEGVNSCGTPVVASAGPDGGYILWDTYALTDYDHPTGGVGLLSYASYSGNGAVSEVKTVRGELSDCQPILYNGKIVWYVTGSSHSGASVPTFYVLDESGLSSYKTDIPYSDVTDGKWFAAAASYVWKYNLMDPFGFKLPKLFDNNRPVSRSDVAVALYRMEGRPIVSPNMPFTDIASANYEIRCAAAWAYGNNVIGGESGTVFGNGSVTREQLAVMFYRFAQYHGRDVSGRADLSGFTDRTKISSYASDAMQWAVSQELIQGTSSGTLDPQGVLNRPQLATILMRFRENFFDL